MIMNEFKLGNNIDFIESDLRMAITAPHGAGHAQLLHASQFLASSPDVDKHYCNTREESFSSKVSGCGIEAAASHR